MAPPSAKEPGNGQDTALLISPAEEDHRELSELFQHHNWVLLPTRSLGSASPLLKEMAAPVVITERDLPVGNWKDVLETTDDLPARPLVIVMSRLADPSFWAEALNLGAYDVLAKPLDQTEVVRVLTSAWMHRNHGRASEISPTTPEQQNRAGSAKAETSFD